MSSLMSKVTVITYVFADDDVIEETLFYEQVEQFFPVDGFRRPVACLSK